MYRILVLFIAVALMTLAVHAEYGVLFTRSSTSDHWNDHLCYQFNPLFADLPDSEESSTVCKVVDLTIKDGCNTTDYNGVSVQGSIVVVSRGNCTFSQKGRLAQQAGAKYLVVSSNELLTPSPNSTEDYKLINISVGTALNKDISKYVHGKKGLNGILYSPRDIRRFDPNLVVIFLIAVSNIVIGGFWSGVHKHRNYQRLKYKHKRESQTTEGRRSSTGEDSDSDNEEQESVDVSMIAIVVGFVFVVAFLVLLYFFYDYLIYVVIALFGIAGAMGLYYCLCPLIHKVVPCDARLPKNRVPLFKSRPEYRELALLMLCFGVSIFWGVMRHASYAWVLQDVLGFAFCINVMKTVGIPNMKICTVLLVMLFIYDIFFVFITPLFTKDGKSVMVEVATGGSSKSQEKIPMLFLVPKLAHSALSVCGESMSMLGFGDVVIPGLLICHNHYFDLRLNTKRVYYIFSCIGYAVGLIVTFVALAFMQTGQPALLYLVPCTLIPTYVIGCMRGEVKQLWKGPVDPSDVHETGPNSGRGQNSENLQSARTDVSHTNEGSLSADSASSIHSNSALITGSDNDSRQLLRRQEPVP